ASCCNRRTENADTARATLSRTDAQPFDRTVARPYPQTTCTPRAPPPTWRRAGGRPTPAAGVTGPREGPGRAGAPERCLPVPDTTQNTTPMTSALQPDNPALRAGLYRLYRDFFDRAERKRRWSLREDIPW